MKIKEYTTELDADKKNVLREVGHYVIVKEKYNSPQKFADFAREKRAQQTRSVEAKPKTQTRLAGQYEFMPHTVR